MRAIAILFSAIAISACGSTPQDSPAAAPAPEPVAMASETGAADGQPSSEIDVVDIHEVPETEVDAAPQEAVVKCRMERRTGSNRAQKVCRKQGDSRTSELDAQRTFDRLHRSQQTLPCDRC